jgi:hypothetical protein
MMVSRTEILMKIQPDTGKHEERTKELARN